MAPKRKRKFRRRRKSSWKKSIIKFWTNLRKDWWSILQVFVAAFMLGVMLAQFQNCTPVGFSQNYASLSMGPQPTQSMSPPVSSPTPTGTPGTGCPPGQVLVNGVCVCQGFVPDPTGCLTASCSGYNSGNIRVTINWCSALEPLHSVQKYDLWPNDPETAWDFLPHEGPGRTYIDELSKVGLYSGANYLTPGETYGYRVKYFVHESTVHASPVIQVPITPCFCSP